VAHRGASLRYPENTLAAFRAAVRVGADVIELDARLTADGVPVVMHDADVATTTDGSGFVHELTLAQVSALRAGPDPARRASVPTLRQALAYLRGRATVEIDLKNEPGEPGFDGTHRRRGSAQAGARTAARPRSWLVGQSGDHGVGQAASSGRGHRRSEAGEGENLWEWIDYAAGRAHDLMPDAAAVLSAGADFVAGCSRTPCRPRGERMDRERPRDGVRPVLLGNGPRRDG
jgi:hypothetical protein